MVVRRTPIINIVSASRQKTILAARSTFQAGGKTRNGRKVYRNYKWDFGNGFLEFMYVPSDAGVNSTNAPGYFDKVNGAGIIVMRTILCFISPYTFFIRPASAFHHLQDGFCQREELSLSS